MIRSSRRRGGRVALGMVVSTAVTGFVLAVPVVSSGAPTSTPVDSSSSAAARFADESSPVVMGRDGAAASSKSVDAPVVPPAPDVPEVPERELEAAATAESPAPVATPETTAEAPAPTTSPAPTTASAASADAPTPDAEAEVIALVNDVRSDAGCDPVEHDEGLARVARAHSADMRDQDFFDHENLAGLDPFERAEAAGQTNARAENIAHGQADPSGVMGDWMDSSGHRANILDCELRTLGVGIAEGPGGPWWTQLFGD